MMIEIEVAEEDPDHETVLVPHHQDVVGIEVHHVIVTKVEVVIDFGHDGVARTVVPAEIGRPIKKDPFRHHP